MEDGSAERAVAMDESNEKIADLVLEGGGVKGIALVGAISVLAFFQGYFESGFTLLWWEPLTLLAYLIVMMTGFVFYRYRRTRSLTLAEFFERHLAVDAVD